MEKGKTGICRAKEERDLAAAPVVNAAARQECGVLLARKAR